MPGKKGKKGKKEKKDKSEPTAGGDGVDENSKQFFILQIKDLEEKLKRYQRKCDELEILSKKYESQYETSNNDKRDIVANLKKDLDKKSDEILDLNDRLVGLQQAKEAEKEAFEKQLTDLRTEFQETKDVLTNQNNSLLAKLTALEEFKSQKEELLAKLDTLQQNIEFLENDHKNKLNEIEKKVIIDKDRLKKEMVVKVSQVAAEFRRVSNKQMADTTKRTIKENVSINNQLQKMSEKVVEMIDDNENSKIKGKVNKQQIDLLEDNEKELAKKNVSNLKVIRLLTEKCRNQEALLGEFEEKINELKQSEINNQELIAKYEEQIKELDESRAENARLSQLVDSLQEKLSTSNRYRAKVERVMKQATESLVISLSKDNSGEKTDEKNEDGEDSGWNDIEKRDNMLENMLVLLNSAAAIGIGPNPAMLSSNYTQRPRTSEYPGSGKGIRKSQVPSDFLERNFKPHYELGDLGIVPRQSEQLNTKFEKIKQLAPQKELGNIKMFTRRTVSTQTIDLTKASLFGVEADLSRNLHTHPIFESSDRKPQLKSQIVVPINDQHRQFKVTDKVF